MHLDDYGARVQQHLAAAAALGDEHVQQIAAKLGDAAGSAVRLAILSAVSEAVEEINALLLDFPLAPSVSVRLDGDDLRVEVDATASQGVEAAAPDEGEASARISLRLTESLKTQIDEAAARDGVSVNTWLVRAAAAAVNDSGRRGGTTFTVNTSAHRISGFING
jgi:hypothetical protein